MRSVFREHKLPCKWLSTHSTGFEYSVEDYMGGGPFSRRREIGIAVASDVVVFTGACEQIGKFRLFSYLYVLCKTSHQKAVP